MIWKDIPGYIGLYQASSTGLIKSLPKRVLMPNGIGVRIQPEIIFKPCIKDRYLSVFLSKDGKKSKLLVHRLIAFTFLDTVDGKEFVNHKDGVKHNNDYQNLEWCTRSENSIHALHTGLNDAPPKRSKLVSQFTKEGVFVQTFLSYRDAAKSFNRKLGVNINMCAAGKTKTAYGFKWKEGAYIG